jgi:hypothetical protein
MVGVAATVITAALAPGLIWAAAVALAIALVLALELFNPLRIVVDKRDDICGRWKKQPRPLNLKRDQPGEGDGSVKTI